MVSLEFNTVEPAIDVEGKVLCHRHLPPPLLLDRQSQVLIEVVRELRVVRAIAMYKLVYLLCLEQVRDA